MVSLPSVRFACSRNAGRPLVKAAIHCSFASTLQLLELSVISIMSPISHCSAVQIFTNTSVVTFSFFPSFAIDAWLIPAATHKSIFLIVEMSRNVQSGNTQNLKSMVIQRSFPKWSVAERRKTAAASDQAAVCACAHSRYFAGGSPSGLRV